MLEKPKPRRWLPRPLRVAIASLALILSSLFHIIPLLIVALFKAAVRFRSVRTVCDRWLMAIAASWIDFNSLLFDRMTDTRVIVTGLPEPMVEGHFLLICNHQSWVDIPVLQKLFNRRLPLLRFFLKSQLFWVPVMGLAWWALDFPFMKRYTRAQIERKPALAGRDIQVTRKACEKFRRIPVSVVNFVEGTRHTPTKHDEQASPFQHLLKPRAGGTAFVLEAMGETLDTLVDVTIVYPHGAGELGELFSNRIPEIRVHIDISAIPEEFRSGSYQDDPAHRQRMQTWINQLWLEKDARIAAMLAKTDSPPDH